MENKYSSFLIHGYGMNLAQLMCVNGVWEEKFFSTPV